MAPTNLVKIITFLTSCHVMFHTHTHVQDLEEQEKSKNHPSMVSG